MAESLDKFIYRTTNKQRQIEGEKKTQTASSKCEDKGKIDNNGQIETENLQ